MNTKFFKRLITVIVAISLITLYTVIAAPTVIELEKYQEKNSICAFTTDDFENCYTDTSPLESITITSLPDNGTLYLHDTKVSKNQTIQLDDISSLTLTPNDNFTGTILFTFKASNNTEQSNITNAKITYIENLSNSIPTANSFSIETLKNTPKKAKLNYEYSSNQQLYFTIIDQPKNGKVELTATTGEFIYTPFTDKVGMDSFTFKVSTDKITSNLATCNITISEPVSTPAPFHFVYQDTVNHWVNYSAIKMVEKDVYKGERIGDKYYFRPDTLMTRIDVINYILSVLDIDTNDIDTTDIHIFTDSPDLPDYINKSAYQAYKLNIIEGKSINNGLYLNPYDNITRAEIVKMIDKAMGAKTRSDIGLNFIDGDSIPDWSVQHFKNLIAYGIIHGYDDNSIRPFAQVTKAQATEMLYQLLKYNEENAPTFSARVSSGMYNRQDLL